MILVDTSVIVAWLEPDHEFHDRCTEALGYWAGEDQLAISNITYAELAASGRTREAVEERLSTYFRMALDWDAAWRAGQAYRRWHPGKLDRPVLPDFLIRAQAAVLGIRHLTNDRR